MKKYSVLITSALLSMLLASCAQASHPTNKRHKHVAVDRHVVVRPASVRPVATHVINARYVNLPTIHTRVIHRDLTYYYSDGVYYLREPAGYVIANPPLGIRVASLPSSHTRIRISNEYLYRYNGINYRKVNGFFIVVQNRPLSVTKMKNPVRTKFVVASSQFRLGSAKVRIRSPPRRPRDPPPDATETYSWPSITQIDGDANTPAPVLNFHNSSPVDASQA